MKSVLLAKVRSMTEQSKGAEAPGHADVPAVLAEQVEQDADRGGLAGAVGILAGAA